MVREILTERERDELGEVANICMGNSATTLSMMVNRRVDITTPHVEIIDRADALNDYEKTCFFVYINYIKGLEGNNVLIMKASDVLLLTTLMMGMDPSMVDKEISELHISALSEAMNQMMGASATSMSTMLGEPVDISTPKVLEIDVDSVKNFERIFNSSGEKYIKIRFRVQVGDLIDSNMEQMYPISFAETLVELFDSGKLKMR